MDMLNNRRTFQSLFVFPWNCMWTFFTSFVFSILIVVSGDVCAHVFFYDDVVIGGREVALRAETRGAFLLRGGELVEFFVNGKSIGKSLSGGDGIAFRYHVFPSRGLYKIRVVSGKSAHSGVVYVLGKKSPVVCIDVEGGLTEGMFYEKVQPGSVEAVKSLQKRYPVIFLGTGLLSVKGVKAWLKKHNFPDLPVLSWRQGGVFKDLSEKGFVIKAVIGRPEVVDSAKEYTALRLSFHPLGNGETVEDWEEIVKRLK